MAKKRTNPDWNFINEGAAKKRMGKVSVRPKSANSTKIASILFREEMVVQRLSSELSGKTPKYAPLGPREFVPFTAADVTFEEIKSACLRYFGKIDNTIKGSLCDVLASERGPSCSHIDQIPNLALVHVRFVHNLIPSSKIRTGVFKRPEVSQSVSLFAPGKAAKQSIIAKSLSISTMLKIGQGISDDKKLTNITLKEFSISTMTWDEIGDVMFQISEEVLGCGAFRNVFSAYTKDTRLPGTRWVVKRYNERAEEVITEARKQSLEMHTRLAVQMTCLSDHFAKQLADINPSLPRFCYVKTYFGKIGNREYVTIEERMDGFLEKMLNNDGYCNTLDELTDIQLKAHCLAHFTLFKSEEKLLLTDIQGFGMVLTDPEIASSEFSIDEKALFCVGNICRKAIKLFGMIHECNKYCKLAGLHDLDLDKFQSYDDTITTLEGVKI